ncbi:hypothetical protein Tco_0760830 [Tanacetum coccineum]
MTSRPRTRVFRPGPVWGCDSVGGCSLLQMIYGLKSLKLFMVMKVVLIIMATVSRVHRLILLDPQTSFTRKIGQLNIVASEDTCVWNLGPNGTFTVKDAHNIIDQKTIPSFPSTSWDKIIPRKRQFDFILDGLTEVPSNDRMFRQWLNALFQKAAFLSRLLPRGLFGVSSKTTSK